MARSYSQKTIKLLFARARNCAYPGCDEPLVLQHRGRLTVVAEIAHIRSEVSKGPRHDPAYPASSIDEEENLLLLCGKHHKPVDDHASVYPIDELLAWKRKQVGAGSERDLPESHVERIFLHYHLNRLGHDGFEKICQALTARVLGPGTEIPRGLEPDGGRDAWFNGRTPAFPDRDAPWDGYIVMQAIYSQNSDRPHAIPLLGSRIRRQFERWSTARSERWHARSEVSSLPPEYVIFATNLQLTTNDELGRIDTLINLHATELGLRGWQLWDETRIADLLNLYPDVRQAVTSLSTSNEIVAGVLAKLSAVPSAEPHFRPGQPGQEAAFLPVYEAAGGIHALGRALGPVAEHQHGWLQHFSGGTRGEPAVLCALYGKAVVAVATAVWNDIEAIGSGVVHGGSIGAGFPVAGKPSRNGYIGSDAEVVDLAGGMWGPAKRGQLVRSPSGPAQWRPETAFDSNASRDRDTWSSLADQRDLRVRVAARIPLVGTQWRISRAGRSRMLDAVDNTGITASFHALAERYSLEVSAGSWQEISEPDGMNNSRFAAYQVIANAADGHSVFALCLRLTLPDSCSVDVHTTVDLRVDFSGLAAVGEAHDDVPVALRLTLAELTDFFIHAWSTATLALPIAAVEDLLAVPLAGAPRLELHIHNEQIGRSDRRKAPAILNMIDLSPLGAPRGIGPSNLSVGVTTALGLTTSEIDKSVRDALVWMVEDAGFVTPPTTRAAPSGSH